MADYEARHRIFKGATRPAMFFGIPLVPFVLASGLVGIVAMWAMYLASGYVALLILAAYLPLVIWMRMITKKDDQRLRLMLLRARLRSRHAAKPRWGAIAYSPLRLKRRT